MRHHFIRIIEQPFNRDWIERDAATDRPSEGRKEGVANDRGPTTTTLPTTGYSTAGTVATAAVLASSAARLTTELTRCCQPASRAVARGTGRHARTTPCSTARKGGALHATVLIALSRLIGLQTEIMNRQTIKITDGLDLILWHHQLPGSDHAEHHRQVVRKFL